MTQAQAPGLAAPVAAHEPEGLERQPEDTDRGVVALCAELDRKAVELRHASEAKSRFISNISHELRTPLNATLALTRLLLDRVDGPLTEEQEKQVRFIRQSAEGLLDLVDDLLDIARIEAGKVTIRHVPFAIADLFAGLRATVGPLPTGEAVRLVFEDPPALPTLVTDDTKLAQILRNLLTNALKFTPSGEVRLAVARTWPPQGPARVTFTVSDTGIGIAAADQARIFAEFEQVAGALQAQNRGIGLGLPLSRRLATLLGGTLTVTSTPGAGSSFRLTVPVRHPQAPAAPALPGQLRVLVIDDEPAARYVMRRLIEAEPGWEVEEGAGGADGLARARARPPDAILLDPRLPAVDGFDVLCALAADPATRGVPVVACTSLPVDDALHARLPPGTPVLSKGTLDRPGLNAALAAAICGEPTTLAP